MKVKSIAECSKREHSAILSTFIKLPFVIKIIGRLRQFLLYNNSVFLLENLGVIEKIRESELFYINFQFHESVFVSYGN